MLACTGSNTKWLGIVGLSAITLGFFFIMVPIYMKEEF